jgi:hypothetical protein
MNLDEWIAVLEEWQDIAYKKGYKAGWNGCIRSSAEVG